MQCCIRQLWQRERISLFFVSLLSIFVCLGFSPRTQADFNGLPPSLQGELTESQVKNIAIELKYLDEVLTSSVLSYAFSGDEKWLDRYYDYEPKLTALINALLGSQTDSDREIVSDLEAANFLLVEWEMRALDYAKAGDRKAAMDLINSDDYHHYKNQYMGLLLNLANRIEQRAKKQREESELKLTQAEKQWISENTIKVGVENWPPMLYRLDDHQVGGLAGEIVNQIMHKTGLNVELVDGEWSDLLTMFERGELDVLPHAYQSEARKEFGDFSTPYFLVRELFFVKQDAPYRLASDLSQATIAISEGYTTIEKVRTLYPDIKVIETPGIDQAIKAVLDGKADAVLDAETVILNWLATNQESRLRSINEDVVSPSTLHLWSSNQHPELQPILQKGLDSLELRDLILTKNDWYQPAQAIELNQDNQSLLESLRYVVAAVIVLFLILGFITLKVFQASDKELANKFSSKSFKHSVISVQVILCIALLTTALMVTRYAERQSISAINYSLSTLLTSTHKRMTGWVELELDSLGQLGRNPQLVEMVEELLEITPTPSALISAPIQEDIRAFINERTGIAGSFGYFIISPEKISLSSRRDANIGGINLIQLNRPDLMEEVLSGRGVFIPPIRSDVALENHDGKSNPPTMFFAVPIYNSANQVIAVLTKRVNFEGVFSTVLSAGFIGRSGETYAIDRTGLLLSNVRFEDQLREIGLLDEGVSSSLHLRVANPGVNLTETPMDADASWPLTEMAQSISDREAGVNLKGCLLYTSPSPRD